MLRTTFNKIIGKALVCHTMENFFCCFPSNAEKDNQEFYEMCLIRSQLQLGKELFFHLRSKDQSEYSRVEIGATTIFQMPEKHHGQGIMYTNNCYYEGEMLDFQASGQGKIVFMDKSIYRGEMSHNEVHGQGEMVSDKFQLHYRGEWVHGYPSKGLFTLKSETYSISDLEIPNADPHDAIHQSDLICLRICMPDGSEYHGQVENNKLHTQGFYFRLQGHGSMKFPDGSTYSGTWNSGLMHGQGTYTWPNGDKYKGQYLYNRKNGRGTYYFQSSKKKYEGYWINDQPHPEGQTTTTTVTSLENSLSLSM